MCLPIAGQVEALSMNLPSTLGGGNDSGKPSDPLSWLIEHQAQEVKVRQPRSPLSSCAPSRTPPCSTRCCKRCSTR